MSTDRNDDDSDLNFTIITRTKSHNTVLASDPVGYERFLRRMCLYGIDPISRQDIDRNGDEIWGSGATVSVCPGTWHRGRVEANSGTREAVALKYCKVAVPQDEYDMPELVNAMNFRLESLGKELQILGSRTSKYYKSFPRLFGICWDELPVFSLAPVYRPILVVEAAISNLEEYVREGQLNHPGRNKDEKRFISSALSAMNFLHQDCGLIHGDLKPSNILMFWNTQTEETDLKLADFGFADKIGGYRPDGEPQDPPQLEDLYWSAPELYQDDYFRRTTIWMYTGDYYSFGLIVWFILFGYPIGDLQGGLRIQDHETFKRVKQGPRLWRGRGAESKVEDLLPCPELNDLLKDSFNSRWKWDISDQKNVEALRAIKETDNDEEVPVARGNLLADLIGNRKIRELEWDFATSAWRECNDHLHHVYRALMETALHRHDIQRRSVLHRPAEELIIPSVSFQLAALHIIGHSDPKSEVLETYELKHGLNSLSSFDRQISHWWNSAREDHKDGNDNALPPLQSEVVDKLPEKMAEIILEELLSTASDEKTDTKERNSAIVGIQSFRKRFTNHTDFNAWTREGINSGPATKRIQYVLTQKLQGAQIDSMEEQEWTLEGITTVPGQDVGASLLTMIKDIDPSLTKAPLMSALWDYVTDVPINSRPSPSHIGRPPPIFQAILNGNLQAFKSEETRYNSPLSSLVFDEMNLLNFAILHKKPEFMRYLVVDKAFVIGRSDGYSRALNALLFDADADQVLIELSICHSLAKKQLTIQKYHYDELDDIPYSPLTLLFEPEMLSLIAEAGSRSFMNILDAVYRDPLNMEPKIFMLGLMEEAEEEWNPLYGAIQTRRLTTFLQLLDWGTPRSRAFSPDSMINGASLLVHAVRSMAPFFVGALLLHGAAVNQKYEVQGGGEETALVAACCCSPQHYKLSLKRRYELHVEMGFPDSVLKQDKLAFESAEKDFEALQILTIEILLRNGADINLAVLGVPDPGTGDRLLISPLVASFVRSTTSTAVSMFLIRHGAELNPTDTDTTPLQHAINENLPEVVECLLDCGASPDGRGPALLNATLCNRPDMIQLLLDRGASLEMPVTSCGGELILHNILKSTSEKYFQSLSPTELATALSNVSLPSLEACMIEKKLQRQILLAHLKKMTGPDLRRLMNKPSPSGATAIFYAAEYVDDYEDYGLLRLIIENTDDIAALMAPGFTAIERATVTGNFLFVSTCLAIVTTRLTLSGAV